MIGRCWRLTRSFGRTARPLGRWFCDRKDIELSKQQWQRLQDFMKSIATNPETEDKSEKLFNTPEQELSFKLLQGKGSQDILKVLNEEQPDKLTPAMLFLVVYCYSKFANPCDAVMLPHLRKVVKSVDTLDDASLVKLYELLHEHQEEMEGELPELPHPRHLQPELLLDFVYILCQLYTSNPRLDVWLQLLNSENSAAAPNILLSIMALNPTNKQLQSLVQEVAETCDDQVQLGRMALCALQNDQHALAKRLLAKLTPDPSEPDLYVDLLCRLVDIHINDELASSMLEQLPEVHLLTCSLETYINVWTLVSKVANLAKREELINKLTNITEYENLELAQIDTENSFTIFIMSAFLEVQDQTFIRMLGGQLLKSIDELPADKVFYLYAAAGRLSAAELKITLKSRLDAVKDKLSPKCLKLYNSQP